MRFLTLLLFFVTSAFANVNVSLVNIEWQKNYLERDIKAKVQSKIDKILAEKQYTIDVEIVTTIPKKPSFKQTPKQQPEEVKFTNAKKPTPGDYIVFSKFGLETPITANMNPKEPPKNSEYEYLWKFQESQSVFNNLESIKVILGLPNSLSDQQRKGIEELVKTTKFNLRDFQVEFEFKYMDLKPLELFKKKEAKKDGLVSKQTADLIAKVATPIGILVAAIIIALCSLVIFKKYAALRSELMQSKVFLEGNQKSENESKEDETSDSSNGAAGMLGGAESSGEDGISGIERFIKTMDENPDTIYLLVKNWIRSTEKNSQHALVYLLDKIESKHLHSLFNQLSLSERQEWKSFIEKIPYSAIDTVKIDNYITTAIINNFIVPDVIDDTELKSKLLSLDEYGARNFVNDNPDLTPVFLSVSPTHVINKVIASFDKSERTTWLKKASQVDVKGNKDILKQLSEKLSRYASDTVVSPFVEKIIALIPTAEFEDEQSLYDILLENNVHQKARALAFEYYPSFLFSKLSEKSMNTILMSFSMGQRAEIIESFDDEGFKNQLISSFAKEGSTALEMYNLEIERFVVDDAAKEALEENKPKYISNLYMKTRNLVRTDEEITREAKSIIDEWISGSDSQSEEPVLKVA